MLLQQSFGNTGMSLLGSEVERRHSVAVGCGDGRPVRHEQRDRRRVALLGSKVQRRAVVGVGCSRCSHSLLDECQAYVHMTLEGGQLQRRHPVFVSGLG